MNTRLVKRYSNRRLYDTKASRTITQFDLARMVREGEDVQVVEAATGKDITVEVLSRVMIAETGRWGNLKETRDFLQDLIRTGGDKSMSILRNTILASIGALHVTKDKAEKIIDDLIKKGELDKSDRKKAVMELLQKAEKSTADLRARITKEAEKAQKSVGKLTSGLNWARAEDIKKLEAKIKRLTTKINQLEKKLDEKPGQ
jgi:polyhydroxyalkanoate synthesis repressor PhaR